MTEMQYELFWREVDFIQTRHAIFFSKDQIKYIQVTKLGSGCFVTYHPEANLPEVVRLEVDTALRLVLG
jgi:hypothetical protein